MPRSNPIVSGLQGLVAFRSSVTLLALHAGKGLIPYMLNPETTPPTGHPQETFGCGILDS